VRLDWLSKQRVVVTGGAGFLGSFVVEKLRQAQVNDIIVVRSAHYDLTHEANVKRLFADTQPDVVLHLAARVGGIGANRAHPGSFFYHNLVMGVLLMEYARLAGLKKFVTVGTVCSYPKFTPVPFKEEALWDGYPEETNAPYGLAKKMLLVQSQTYREEYGMNAIYLMPVNLYGPGDNYDPTSSHVIPALIRKCIEARERGDERIVVWGNGSASREFLYAEDAAEGIVLATERYNQSEPVNLGTGQEITIADLVQLIASITGFQGTIEWDTSKPNGQPRRMLDTSRARREFSFEAQTGFLEGLTRTVQWYEQVYRTQVGSPTPEHR
jgi:GDP-L-fucose synthase